MTIGVMRRERRQNWYVGFDFGCSDLYLLWVDLGGARTIGGRALFIEEEVMKWRN